MQPPSSAEATARTITKGIFLLGAAVLLMLVVVIGVRAWLFPPEAPSTDRVTVSNVSTGSGEWNAFRYTYGWTDEGFVVTFTPFLPRNDDVVVAAMRHIAAHHFKLSPTGDALLVTEGDRTFIGLPANGVMLMFLPIKQDSGEVHSLVARRR